MYSCSIVSRRELWSLAWRVGSVLRGHKGCRTLVQTRTAAEPSDASDQIRTDALCAHQSRRFRPEPKWLLTSVPLVLSII